MNILEIESVSKSFGDVLAVDDLTLGVPPGSIYGFIGPNGAGKTTTIRMIMNIFYPDSGRIRMFGQPVQGGVMDRVGYLPEERGLYRKMKVREVLAFHGSLKNGVDVNGEIQRWLKRFDLLARANDKVATLSKGMTQKVQFISAVVSRPDLLILDEPFTGLDPVNVEVFREAVLDLRRAGTTVIFSTHDMSMAEQLCDYIFMITGGKKVLDGTLASIQEKYGRDVVRVRCENGMSTIDKLAGVAKIRDLGREQELRLTAGTDPQDLLMRIMEQTEVLAFEIMEPSLHDIFIRIASPDGEEPIHA